MQLYKIQRLDSRTIYHLCLRRLVRSTSLNSQNSYAISRRRPIKRYPSCNGMITRDDAGCSIKSIAGSCISRQQLYSPLWCNICEGQLERHTLKCFIRVGNLLCKAFSKEFKEIGGIVDLDQQFIGSNPPGDTPEQCSVGNRQCAGEIFVPSVHAEQLTYVRSQYFVIPSVM